MLTLKEYAAWVERALEDVLPEVDGTQIGRMPEVLNRSMRYSLLGGGKRLRPAMMVAAVDMLGGDVDLAMPYACAVEMIHTYSLIHDDLPGMDDDTLRRGRATNHVMFGVGQAILAGDGLLSYAFEMMLSRALNRPESLRRQVRAIYEIARGAGVTGMVAGQCMDLNCEHAGGGGVELLTFIHVNKTARMFMHPLRAAGCLCDATEEQMDALTRYGRAFGMMFQAADDLLDVEGTAGELGKSVGKDAQVGKLTAPVVYGVEGARARVGELLDEGLDALKAFDERADFFRDLIRQMNGRRA